MQVPPTAKIASAAGILSAAVVLAASLACAQTSNASLPQSVTQAEPAGSAIAIVPLNADDPNSAATVTGALEVSGGKAMIAASGSITSGTRTTEVTLPHRGVLRICAATTVKLAADSSVPAGETPGLLMAMDHGAIETSFASGRNADILLTPDFRILIGGPGASDLKVRLGSGGDTCIDNTGLNAPYVVVTSLFDPGLYRVQPGQRVMFQHGSLKEVVDQEQEPCGCPPAPAPADSAKNEFPLAQSEGLAPTPAPAPNPKQPANPGGQAAPPLVYSSGANVSATAPVPADNAGAPAGGAASEKPAQKKKAGFFTMLGHFLRRIFGAESS
jgi:hypothetical protein